MSQARVTEYYATRKKRRVDQPSKRRKVDFTETEPTNTQVKVGPSNLSSVKTNIGPNLEEIRLIQQQQEPVSQICVTTRRSTRSSSKRTEKTPAKSNTRKSARAKSAPKTTIPDLFENIALAHQSLLESSKDSLIQPSSVDQSYAEATDCWDEHDGFSSNADETISTPNKPSFTDKSLRKRKKDGRIQTEEFLRLQSTPSTSQKKTQRDLKQSLAKKKLELNTDEDKLNTIKENEIPTNFDSMDSCVQEPNKDNLIKIAAGMSPPKAISPLPGTPQKVLSSRRKKEDKALPEKLLVAMEKCKSLTQNSSKEPPLIDPAVVKARLAKCGKLEELKAQLAKMNKTKSKTNKGKPKVLEKVESPKLQKFDSIEIEVEKPEVSETNKVPAYERHHHLVTPAAPTLSLPYKYRVLAEMFRGMDTVVSMLHNRSEIITFSKLKAAVQTMKKRNFEKEHAGQIKTVFPSGYVYRQEKGLPCYGGKTPGYQLTVEPNLQQGEITDTVECKSNVKIPFSAAHLLKRRGYFHNRLIDIVKRYHREFLSSLKKPLSIPDDKITRWHPQFKLDEVPNVDPSPLPEPPFEMKYHTAKDVLEATRGKTLPRVEKALETVANKNNKTSTMTPPPGKLSDKSSSIKGVPQTLLEKIRAKEAAKLELTLTRDPVEEKKTLMMSRLPDMMRIVRNYFITEKKSSLPMDPVLQKLQDSFRSSIALADLETHVKLMLEFAPEWLTMQQIRKGRYLKLNTQVQLQGIQDKLKDMVNQRK